MRCVPLAFLVSIVIPVCRGVHQADGTGQNLVWKNLRRVVHIPPRLHHMYRGCAVLVLQKPIHEGYNKRWQAGPEIVFSIPQRPQHSHVHAGLQRVRMICGVELHTRAHKLIHKKHCFSAAALCSHRPLRTRSTHPEDVVVCHGVELSFDCHIRKRGRFNI